MSIRWKYALPILALAVSFAGLTKAQSADEQKLVELTNEARAQAGLKPVVWDAPLAAAAHAHAERMAAEPAISHQYPGEPELSARASQAGAGFSLIAENVAQGTSPGQIHGAWMQSKGHHDNLMNADVDHIGVSIVRARGSLYAVVDFTRSVAAMAPSDVEAKVRAILQSKGMTLSESSGARQYCALNEGESGANLGLKAKFLMRWQSSDISKLPPKLEEALASGQFTQAQVGACAPKGDEGKQNPVFSGYRLAVLLF